MTPEEQFSLLVRNGLNIVQSEVLRESISLIPLQPGDVLLCQPKNSLSEAQSESLHRQLSTMVGNQVKVAVLPATWKIAVGRQLPERDELMEGLKEMIEDLS